MYVINLNEDTDKQEVGHYNPSGEFIVEEEYDLLASARRLCHYLNGGGGSPEPVINDEILPEEEETEA